MSRLFCPFQCYESYQRTVFSVFFLLSLSFSTPFTLPFLPAPLYPPLNLIYSLGSSQKEKGVQNDLLFPEAKTSPACGGHCLCAAQRSEHYSACFNDAQEQIEGERKREYERAVERERGREGFFYQSLLTP